MRVCLVGCAVSEMQAIKTEGGKGEEKGRRREGRLGTYQDPALSSVTNATGGVLYTVPVVL